MTIIELKRYANYQLSSTLPLGELQAVVNRLLLTLFGVSKIDVIMRGDDEIEVDMRYFDSLLRRILRGEPVQYVLSLESFLERDFYVNSSVLIPRPETEELVEIVISENKDKRDLQILDIGTGSGAIAISLALELNGSKVRAYDISKDALLVAKRNSTINGAENIEFEQCDILRTDHLDSKYDIIISNPPYVTESEKELMQPNVTEYEPEIALYVPDDQPLLFYDKISSLASVALKSGGILYFEINEQFGEQVKESMIGDGFSDVEIVIDFRDRVRFVKGVKV